ncbi:MAG: MlaD family protein [Cytophagaceae bacterium]|nr:MlaD family protein [Cytophagaceae bacterium]
MKISKEVKVGFLAVISIAILYFGFNFLKGSELFSNENEYYALYDNVGGLTASNAVMLNGLAVGRVKEIRLLQERSNQLLVTISVGKNLKLSNTTVASLGDGGLLGGKMINLLVEPGGTLLKDKDTLRTVSPKGLQALIQEQALPVLKSADSLIVTLRGVASKFDSTGYAVNRLLKTANRTMTTVDATVQTLDATVQENRVNLSTLLANANKLTTSLVETEKEIKPLLGKANSILDSLKLVRLQETVAIANQTLGQVQRLLTDLQSGKGTAGKLLKDEAFYSSANRTMVDLDRLLVDFRQSPKRYVHFSLFGRKEKKAITDSLQKSVEADRVK